MGSDDGKTKNEMRPLHVIAFSSLCVSNITNTQQKKFLEKICYKLPQNTRNINSTEPSQLTRLHTAVTRAVALAPTGPYRKAVGNKCIQSPAGKNERTTECKRRGRIQFPVMDEKTRLWRDKSLGGQMTRRRDGQKKKLECRFKEIR